MPRQQQPKCHWLGPALDLQDSMLVPGTSLHCNSDLHFHHVLHHIGKLKHCFAAMPEGGHDQPGCKTAGEMWVKALPNGSSGRRWSNCCLISKCFWFCLSSTLSHRARTSLKSYSLHSQQLSKPALASPFSTPAHVLCSPCSFAKHWFLPSAPWKPRERENQRLFPLPFVFSVML